MYRYAEDFAYVVKLLHSQWIIQNKTDHMATILLAVTVRVFNIVKYCSTDRQ